RPPMYCSIGASRGRVGLGPSGFGREDRPLPLATYRRPFCGLKRTEVGYQPTGMKPSGLASPGLATLKTATLLASALATKRSWPSGVRLRLLGVLPAGTFG